MEVDKNVIINIAIETWRFRQTVERLLTKLGATEQAALPKSVALVREETEGVSGASRLADCRR